MQFDWSAILACHSDFAGRRQNDAVDFRPHLAGGLIIRSGGRFRPLLRRLDRQPRIALVFIEIIRGTRLWCSCVHLLCAAGWPLAILRIDPSPRR